MNSQFVPYDRSLNGESHLGSATCHKGKCGKGQFKEERDGNLNPLHLKYVLQILQTQI